MPTYKYRAKNGNGTYSTGVVDATSEADAISDIARQGLIPIDVKKQEETLSSINFNELFNGAVGLDELVILCRQMHSLSKAGVPIIRAINGLADSTEHYGLKQSLMKLNKDLIGGKSLTMSMSEQPNVYNSLFVAMINVGENTGKLEEVFAQLGDYYSLEAETRKQISSAMRYPTMVMIFIVVAIIILNIWVIPIFSQMFSKFGVELPLTTRILIGTSNFFVNYWTIILGLIIGIPFLIRFLLKRNNIRKKWDQYKLRIPILGIIIREALLGRFCRSFSLMLQSGVQLNLALTLVAEAIDNKYLEVTVLDMRKQIEQGNSLSVVAMQSHMFTPLVLQMLVVGDETGRVDELLIEAASHYEREVDYNLKSLTAKIEPLLLVVVALMVGLLALGIFTPMWDMYSAMQGK
ncbi:MAG: type II secretion system F family protein [Succinivibrionaceae bacterium]